MSRIGARAHAEQNFVAKEEAGRSRPAADSCRHPGLALIVLALTQLMLVLDGAVVNIALPSIQSGLGMSDGALAWVVNAYLLAGGGLLLIGGRAGDKFGRRRVFSVGMAVFTIASLIGGLADSGALLISARALQGCGAAIASPNALAMISSTFAEGRPRTRALAVYTAASGAGTAVGLIAGGLLTDAFSWRAVMFVNVPFGVLILIGAAKLLAETTPRADRIDTIGAMLSSAGLAAMVFGVSRAGDPQRGWTDPVALSSAVIGVFVLVAFIHRQTRAPRPLIHLSLFRSFERTAAYLTVMLVGGSLSLTYFLSLHVQNVLGYSPARSGLAFLPFAFGIGGGARLSARLLGRLSPGVVSLAGLALAVIGVLQFRILTVDSTYLHDLLLPMIVWSTGMGMIFVPLTDVVLTDLPDETTGIASAVLGTMQQVGGAVGLAVLVTIASAAEQRRAGPPAGLDAVVDGHSAAFSASLALLIAAATVILVMTVKNRSTSRPGARNGWAVKK